MNLRKWKRSSKKRMRITIGVIALFISTMGLAQFGSEKVFSNISSDSILIIRPDYFSMEWKTGTVLTKVETDIYIDVDSMGVQNVNLLVDGKGLPVLYNSNISAPVCADGECRLMDIRFYWNILGGYAGFDRIMNSPLTKHDHDEFLEADYIKLHSLLLDDNSILKRREIKDLVEIPKESALNGVDAVSGATIVEVKESVVSGALYSCYIAWHLVHGNVKNEIKNHSMSLITYDVVVGMLYSNDVDYQLFALNKLNEKQYEEHYIRIAEILNAGIPLVRTFIVKNLSDSIWKSEELQKPYWNCFSTIDINSRSLMLDNLDTASASTIEMLSTDLEIMTKNQIKVYLQSLMDMRNLSAVTKSNLEKYTTSNNVVFGYLVKEFLQDYL